MLPNQSPEPTAVGLCGCNPHHELAVAQLWPLSGKYVKRESIHGGDCNVTGLTRFGLRKSNLSVVMK
jgi:hypothetical protein